MLDTRQCYVAAQRWGRETARLIRACVGRELGSIGPADVKGAAVTAFHFAGRVLDAREKRSTRRRRLAEREG